MSKRAELISLFQDGIISRAELESALGAPLATASAPTASAPTASAPTARAAKRARQRARQRAKKRIHAAAPPALPATAPPDIDAPLPPPALPTTAPPDIDAPLPPPALPTTAPPDIDELHRYKLDETLRGWRAFDWSTCTAPRNPAEGSSVAGFLNTIKPATKRRIVTDLTEHGSIKVQYTLEVEYKKASEDGFNYQTMFHQTKQNVILSAKDASASIHDAWGKLATDSEEFEAHNGSGWSFFRVIKIQLGGVKYQPIRGASWVPTPPALLAKRALVNVKNTLPRSTTQFDDKCFLWSVLAGLHPAAANPDRIGNYRAHENTVDMSGIEYPVMACKRTFQRFEKNNPNISLTVFGYDARGITPRYVDGLNTAAGTKVDLLLLDNGGDANHGHYVYVRALSRLISNELATGNGAVHVCRRCLYSTRDAERIAVHEIDCAGLCSDNPTPVRVPKRGGVDETKIRFRAIEKQMPAPFSVYADFEAMNVPIAPEDAARGNKSRLLTEHVGCSAGYLITERRDGVVSVYAREQYLGENPASWLIAKLQEHLRAIRELIREGQQPPQLTVEEELEFQAATCCHICAGDADNTMVRDHDHLTGTYRGAAHNACNLQWRLDPKRYKLPIFFHNLRGYDSHLLVRAFASEELAGGRISIIPQNFEKYMAMSLGGLAFKDSCQFMADTLENLAKNLGDATPITRSELARTGISNENAPLLLEKGVFPYSWLDGLARFEETSLPERAAFTSDLTGETVSESDYERARTVWRELGCRTFKDYHDLYLQTDVALLADVFESFRTLMLDRYGLDPAHYITAPGMSWDALLKSTKVELELITEMDQMLFVEKGLRGGVCQVSHRAARANNPRAEATGGAKFDPNNPTTWIMYLDANNLYGWAMSKPLPMGGFRWRAVGDLASELEHLATRRESDPRGAFYEVDMTFPPELHDKFSDYPPAPRVGTVKSAQLSPWARNIAGDRYESKKLMLDFEKRERYVCDYRALQNYVKLGLVVERIHRVLEFDQSAWMKPYIDMNTNFRRDARNDFEKDFFKLLNNSVFGKTMEDVRKRTDIQLVRSCEDERLRKMYAKPTFESRKLFGPDLTAVQRRRQCVLLNKPVYVGVAVLDLSKTLMLDYWYEHVKPTYGDRARLLYTDTDSLVIEIATANVYDDMLANAELYDTSNFKTGPLAAIAKANPQKEKFIGLFKDEYGGRVVHSFVGLKPKCYSMMGEGDKLVQRSKGVQNCVTKNVLTHEDYWGVVDGGAAVSNENTAFRTFGHVINTVRTMKTSLSALDTKRWVLPDGITSRPYGHWRNAAAPAAPALQQPLSDDEVDSILAQFT